MLTSFFNKSKPINFLVVAMFMALFYALENFFTQSISLTFSYFFKKTGFLLLYLLLMILMNFIVKRNQVTKRNSFTIILFALFSVSFPAILKHGEILLSVLFVLLALRRVISLKSGIAIKEKIFDASLWICISALFFEWSFLFFGVIFLAILFHAANDYRNWLVPLLGIVCVFVLYSCYHLLVWGSFFNVLNFFQAPSFDFSNYGELSMLLPLSFMLAFSLWTLTDYLSSIQKASTTMKASLMLMLCIWISAIFIVILSPTKDGRELLFFIVPVSVIGAHFFQRKKEKTFKEVLLIFLVATTLLWTCIL